MRLVIRDEAEREIAEAYSWYEEQRRGLGEELVSEIEGALNGIQRNPELYPRRVGDSRACFLRAFPYGIFYVVADDLVEVLAFYHMRRDPDALRGRGE
jgi:toxin ParE1/3/4